MKIAPRQADTFIQDPPGEVRAVLVYGPDQGMVRERADALVVGCAGDRHDPFRVVDIGADELKADPARLLDEAAAFSMTGGRRVICIKNAGDEMTAMCDDVLAAATADALVVIQAGELRPRSSLRRLFEAAAHAAAIACYADDEASVAQVIRGTLNADKIDIDPEALSFLSTHLATDRQLVRAEADKLALYAGAGGRLTTADVQSCIGSSAEFALDDIVYAAADGDQPRLEQALQRAWRADAAPVAVVRALQRHILRLQSVVAAAGGGNPQPAIKALRPPVFWKQEHYFAAQARSWTAQGLVDALGRLVDAEIELKLGQAPDRTACARAAMSLAQMAGRMRRR